MRKVVRAPRILKIESVRGHRVTCVFNNGESRTIDFYRLFKKWKVGKKDHEYPLLDPKEFRKVRLENNTLSWSNVKIPVRNLSGQVIEVPYEISPETLYEESDPHEHKSIMKEFANVIRQARKKQGLTQQELADLSGTSKTYISRMENHHIEPEFSTLRKIVEVGLGRKLKMEIV